MIERAHLLAVARSWLGVPYQHQGRSRHGVDCGGLVGAVAIEAGIAGPGWWREVFDPEHAGYGREPQGEKLLDACRAYLQPADVPAPGDVVAMRFLKLPMHLGILADYRHGGFSVIHALGPARSVVEHRLSGAWSGRVVGHFAYPGVKPWVR